MSIYSAWFGVCRGLGNAWGMTALYVGGNFLQLTLLLIVAGWLRILEPDFALIAYGFAWLPIALVLAPRLLRRIRREDVTLIRELGGLWGPQLLAQAVYAAWMCGDIIVVAHYLGETMAGYYALARTVSAVFVLVPEAISMLLLPHVAAEGARAGRLTARLLVF